MWKTYNKYKEVKNNISGKKPVAVKIIFTFSFNALELIAASYTEAVLDSGTVTAECCWNRTLVRLVCIKLQKLFFSEIPLKNKEKKKQL